MEGDGLARTVKCVPFNVKSGTLAISHSEVVGISVVVANQEEPWAVQQRPRYGSHRGRQQQFAEGYRECDRRAQSMQALQLCCRLKPYSPWSIPVVRTNRVKEGDVHFYGVPKYIQELYLGVAMLRDWAFE